MQSPSVFQSIFWHSLGGLYIAVNIIGKCGSVFMNTVRISSRTLESGAENCHFTKMGR